MGVNINMGVYDILHRKEEFGKCPFLATPCESLDEIPGDIFIAKTIPPLRNWCLAKVDERQYGDFWEVPDLINVWLDQFKINGSDEKLSEIRSALELR